VSAPYKGKIAIELRPHEDGKEKGFDSLGEKKDSPQGQTSKRNR